MKLTILQENLKKGLDIVGRIASKSLTLPILNNILLRAEKSFLNLSATDLELGVNWRTLAKVEEEGGAVVSPQIISGLVGFLPNKPVNINSKGTVVSVDCQNHRSSFRGLNPEDFPIIPSINEIDCFKIPAISLIEGLSQVVDIASLSTTKPEISGVYFVFQQDNLKIVATDSFRLGEKKVALEREKQGQKNKESVAFILPQKAAKEVMNIFEEEDLKICLSPSQVLFESRMAETDAPKVQMISRLIEGEFPNYEAIIPEKYETQITLPKKEFASQVKSASVFSGKTNEVKLKISAEKKQIEIFSQSQELGEYHSEIPCQIKGRDLEIAFNYKFLIDGLLYVAGQEVTLGLTGEAGAAALKGVGDESYIYILMPVKKG